MRQKAVGNSTHKARAAGSERAEEQRSSQNMDALLHILSFELTEYQYQQLMAQALQQRHAIDLRWLQLCEALYERSASQRNTIRGKRR
jgi:hypothetical protein